MTAVRRVLLVVVLAALGMAAATPAAAAAPGAVWSRPDSRVAVPSAAPTVSPSPTAPMPERPELEVQADPADPADPAAGSTFMESIVPGVYDLGQLYRYEIYYSSGSIATSAQRNAAGFATDLTFGGVRWIVQLATFTIAWAYSFGFAATLLGPAITFADAYQADLIGPLGLNHLTLTVAVAAAGWHLLRGRTGRGAGDLAASLLILLFGSMLLANPAGWFAEGLDGTAGLSAAVLEVGTGTPTPTDDAGEPIRTEALAPLITGMHGAFVHGPYDVLNWGAVLDGPCAAQRDLILAEAPHSTDDRPRELMAAAAGCEPHAEFNALPTTDRLMGALLTLGVSVVVLVLMTLVAVTIAVAQVVAAVLIAVAPLAWTFGILPGAGRQLLWRWVASGLRCIAVVVAMSMLLGLLLISNNALLAAAGQTLMERFFAVLLLTAVMVIARKRVLSGTQAMISGVGRRLEAARIGGAAGGGWMRPAAAGGVSGFGIGQLAQEGKQELASLRRASHVDGIRRQVHRAANTGVRSGSSRGGAGSGRGAPVPRAGGGRPASGVGQATRLAGDLTVNLPHAAPRAAAHAHARAGRAAQDVRRRVAEGRARARTHAHEYAHPVEHYRTVRDALRER